MLRTRRRGRDSPVLIIWIMLALPLAASADPLVVATVNYPLAYFAERIGGDAVTVRFPAPPDVDPAFWEPDADDIQDFQGADLILLNGAGYARWVANFTLPRRKLVDTSRGFRDEYLPSSGGVIHSHGPQGGHSHTGVAFTTWLDPQQAIAQARAVEAALKRLRPEHAELFTVRAIELAADLAAVHERLAAAFAALDGRPLLASHPVYQYLARRYGRDVRALLWEPDTLPDDDDWHALDTLLAERPAGWMLWEDEPLATTRERLAERGVDIIVFRPGGNRPKSGDYLSLTDDNVDAVREASDKP